jgi:hypothetical protein
MDPDLDLTLDLAPDPVVFISDLKDGNYNFLIKFFANYFLKLHLHHFLKIKSYKEGTKH